MSNPGKAVSSEFTLPAGDETNGYRIEIKVVITDAFEAESEPIFLSVKVQ